MNELLPCPFCGSKSARMYEPTCDRGSDYDPADRAFPVVRCGDCMAQAIGDNWDRYGKSAITAWNRRTQPEKTP